MEDVILRSGTLPEVLRRRIRSEKVAVHEVDGVITLIPVREYTGDLRGMFSDGRLSSTEFAKRKQIEKELER